MIVSPVKAKEAAEVLGVELQGLTLELLTQAYWRKAKECHPDHHGATMLDAWARVSWSKECLVHWLANRPTDAQDAPDATLSGPKCLTCNGVGRIRISQRRFGAPLTMACTTCKGLGTLEPEEDDHD